MKEKAYAKINLCLDVKRRREDGYHDLEMVMVPLSLHDEIHVFIAKEDCITCDDPRLSLDASNTVVKALHLMRKTFDIKECFHIHIQKKIPMEAGLAGGSADAAALMRALWKLLSLDTSLEHLSLLAKEIGADVPFCIYNTPSIVRGIGEKIEPFDMRGDYHVLLVKPERGVSTKKAFEMLDFTKVEHPDCQRVKEACMQNDWDLLTRFMGNTLEYSALQLVPEIKHIKETLKRLGFFSVLMSGSGSCVFALTKQEAFIDETLESLKKEYDFVIKTKIHL
ncbi:MAG: 4-(cytidine 5'-diphospho)-2-C-methyl-D-erythritol kinase [Erysipelotrichaceae bacterium]|nr:4-(cytidine 5'-diphospho)-2-C-methyl-D-erythritol kinase [Erysipelotrichaceae bacterium]